MPEESRQKQFSIFALDDIQVRPDMCQHKHDYTYTFENDIEDLELEYIQPMDRKKIGGWYRPSDGDKVDGAPETDHTTNSAKGGYFLFMKRDGLSDSTANLDTLSMTNLPKDDALYSCVRFAYQTYGNAILKVFIGPSDANNYFRYGTPVWTPRL